MDGYLWLPEFSGQQQGKRDPFSRLIGGHTTAALAIVPDDG
jgi:hypothetical protein